MKKKCIYVRKTMFGAILLIGLYMLIANWGGVTPPVLSGIAFIIVAMTGFQPNQ